MTKLLAPGPLVVALFVGLAALFALPQVCFACSCLPPKAPLEALGDATAVFRAQVVAVEQLSGPRGVPYQRATVRVTRVWKGSVTGETLLYTGSGGGDCGFNFRRGGDYLIYAHAIREPSEYRNWPIGALSTGICTRTSAIDQASDDLAALGPGQPPTPGLPNTGAGAGVGATIRLIPGEFLIGGGALAFIALVWRGNALLARRRA